MPNEPEPIPWDTFKTKIPDLSSESIAHILAVISASGLRTVHYTGAADEGLLRALLAHEPKLEISAMDMANRWGGGTRFFWDEFADLGMEYPECPDWQKDVVFYQEGAPDHEIAIQDWPWYADYVMKKFISSSHRKPPTVFLLTGYALFAEADNKESEPEKTKILRPFHFKHPAYDWEQRGDVWVGHRKVFST
jgi:hypothetical protein